MFKNGKLFGLVNVIDFLIMCFVVLGVLGVYLVKSGKFITSKKMIEKKESIQFDVSLRGVKLSNNSDLFKAGGKSFITIRNVPYTALEVVKAVKTPIMTVIPDPKNPARLLSVPNVSETNSYDFLVTLKDNALITKDGPIIGGNKVKIGLIVSLEGEKYRINGVVTDVRY
ncbi:MAG: DUF4330 domain-containing protein [bacterium]